jgi:hypothetical protein
MITAIEINGTRYTPYDIGLVNSNMNLIRQAI